MKVISIYSARITGNNHDLHSSGISSRNSEVIHAGIYYQSGTLKAALCVTGKESLFSYLSERNIPHKQCGKIIVASTDAEVPQLYSIFQQATKNGADVRILDSADVKIIEPSVRCFKALYSPRTGIFDSNQYMQNLQADAEKAGAVFVYNCTFLSGSCEPTSRKDRANLFPSLCEKLATRNEGIMLETSQGDIQADIVINASGLQSVQFVQQLRGYPPNLIPKAYFSKGNYFSLNSPFPPFKKLVYPIPEVGGLGIHATVDMSGAVRFGPDVEWLVEEPINESSIYSHQPDGMSSIATQNIYDKYEHRHSVPTDYTVDAKRKEMFYNAIQKYYPDICADDLIPAYCGIRPKLYGPSGPGPAISPTGSSIRNLNDFVIEGSEIHGVQGLVNLFGMESPGLTSSLSIADHVVRQLRRSPANTAF